MILEEDQSVCFGVACPKRAKCDRYAQLGHDSGPAIESCQRGVTWPLFRPIQGEVFGDDYLVD